MALIDLKLGQNAFQVIPDLSLLGVEGRKIFGLDHFVLAGTHMSWPGHMCPGQDKMIETEKSIFFLGLQRQKMKVRGSPETRFGQVSGQSEPSSGGKRTFKVCKNFEKNCFRRRKMKRRESPETRFGKVSSQSEPSSGGKRPFEV